MMGEACLKYVVFCLDTLLFLTFIVSFFWLLFSCPSHFCPGQKLRFCPQILTTLPQIETTLLLSKKDTLPLFLWGVGGSGGLCFLGLNWLGKCGLENRFIISHFVSLCALLSSNRKRFSPVDFIPSPCYYFTTIYTRLVCRIVRSWQYSLFALSGKTAVSFDGVILNPSSENILSLCSTQYIL